MDRLLKCVKVTPSAEKKTLRPAGTYSADSSRGVAEAGPCAASSRRQYTLPSLTTTRVTRPVKNRQLYASRFSGTSLSDSFEKLSHFTLFGDAALLFTSMSV